MTIVELLVFILITFGVTTIIVNSKVFKGIRGQSYLLNCSMCTGFWIGALTAYLSASTTLMDFDHNIVTIIMLGALSAGTSYILDKLVNDDGLQMNLNKTKRKDKE